MFKLLVILGLVLGANATNVNVQSGEIKAHTEVLGDSEINPTTKNVKADLTIDDTIESIKGKIYFETLSLVSDKKGRDEHMHELLKVEKYKTISFDIKSITKNGNAHDINGVVTLNGISKNITAKTGFHCQNSRNTIQKTPHIA
jgi:polyisoprenoid-binding protein YceI